MITLNFSPTCITVPCQPCLQYMLRIIKASWRVSKICSRFISFLPRLIRLVLAFKRMLYVYKSTQMNACQEKNPFECYNQPNQQRRDQSIMEFCQRMKQTRIDHDETQEQVAFMLNITRQQYQLYESNKRQIPVDLLTKFCQYYRVSADYILGLPKGLQWPR